MKMGIHGLLEMGNCDCSVLRFGAGGEGGG